MRLRTKISLVFGAGSLLLLGVVFYGAFAAIDALTDIQMKHHARTFGAFLLQRIQGIPPMTKAELQPQLVKRFNEAVAVATEGKSFAVDKIILLQADYTVQAGYPVDEIGKSYAEHADIRAAFTKRDFDIVLENETRPDGTTETDIDIVAFARLADGQPRVLEIKMNFEQTTALLAAQNRATRIKLGVGLFFSLSLLLGLLLWQIERAAVRPAVAAAAALERVGQGDLGTTLVIPTRDEFGRMAEQFNRMVVGLRERLHLNRYVSGATRAAVSAAAAGESGGPRRRVVTIFFSDIRGFTAYSERRDPGQVVDVLNRILTRQAEIIRAHGGDIDKFVADETMAVFDDELSALRASWAIQLALAAHAAELDGLAVGIGVYSGPVVQGDVGSPEMRDYTIIGDSVNTAARLQSVAKEGAILVAEATKANPAVAAVFAFEKEGDLALKGKSETLSAWRVSGMLGG